MKPEEEEEVSLADVIEEIDQEALVGGPDGTLLFKANLEKLLRDGCVNCLQPLSMDDSDKYIIVNGGKDVLCDDCRWNYDLKGVNY